MLEQILTGALQDAPIGHENSVSESDLTLINNLKNPPLVKLAENEIYVRRCRLAGDAVDAKGGRFRTEDLPKLLEMVQGAPALIGHNRSQLAIARFFGGSLEEHEGNRYIVPKLYWLRAHSYAEDLRLEIDGGLVNEASIAFLYRTPTCAVCGSDYRSCEHMTGTSYNGMECYYYYDEIEAVTEGSLVYRGAEPGTGLLPNTIAEAHQMVTKSQIRKQPRVRYQGKLWRLVPEEE